MSATVFTVLKKCTRHQSILRPHTTTLTASPLAEASAALALGAIGFINTLPIYADLPRTLTTHSSQPRQPAQTLHIHYGTPSALNTAMAKKKLDVSPVSSAFYLQNKEAFVRLNDLSVSSYGSVNSVLFVSKKPLEQSLEHSRIAVPDDSATSIALLAHLLEETCKADPSERFQSYPAAHYQHVLEETGCALVIGDNALSLYETGIPKGYHSYDLATLWNNKTGLPFVFAVWVAQRDWAEANPEQLQQLNESLCRSRDVFLQNPESQKKTIQMAHTQCNISPKRIQHYFTQSLNYKLTPQHNESLDAFEKLLRPTQQETQQHTQPTIASVNTDAT